MGYEICSNCVKLSFALIPRIKNDQSVVRKELTVHIFWHIFLYTLKLSQFSIRVQIFENYVIRLSQSDIEGECMICNEALDDPVQLPCLHVVCFKCAHKWLDEDGHDVCPTCQSKLPADFKVPEEKSNR